jgi:hypothetical protein
MQGRRAGAALLALTYLLTTALVDLGHRHGRDPDESARCRASCRAPGAHLSGHKSPDLTKSDRDCAACQHRVVKVLAERPAVAARAPLVRVRLRREAPAPARLASLPSTVRGPPAPACVRT